MENVTTPGQDSNDSMSFFDSVFTRWSASKVVAMLAFCVTQMFGNALLAGIVWYERCGIDTQYRTLINQLNSAFCVMLVTMNLTLNNAVAYLHLFGPLSPQACSFIVFATNFFLTLGLLLLDTIILLRYLYIFRWKTVGGLNDDLLARFAVVNHLVIAVMLAVILYLLGCNYNVNYYFCINEDPQSEEHRLERSQQTYDIFCILPAFSYVLHVFVFVRIFVYRRQQHSNGRHELVVVRNNVNEGLVVVPNEDEQTRRNVADLCTSMLAMGLIFASSIPTVLIMTYFDGRDLTMQPGLSVLYFSHFGIQFVTSIPLPLIYYARNDGLRQAVIKEFYSVNSKHVDKLDVHQQNRSSCCPWGVSCYRGSTAGRGFNDSKEDAEAIAMNNL